MRDRTYCINCRRRTGRIDCIREQFIDWHCSTCNLKWATPRTTDETVATSIEQHVFASLDRPAGALDADKQIDDAMREQRDRGKDRSSWLKDKLVPVGECECGLPKTLCTIDGHGPNYGAGRVSGR